MVWIGNNKIDLKKKDGIYVLSTSSGKSLCYFFENGLTDYGTSVIVSPLLALIDDKFNKLSELNVSYFKWNLFRWI